MTRQDHITQLLVNALNPVFLEVENESYKHSVPAGSETHFKLTIVADAFQNLERIDRHRKINALLELELKNGLHALSLSLHTPLEWQDKQGNVPKTPPCYGGSRHG